MKFYQKLNSLIGTAEVEIEGFFTERVINLCKFQNIKIWDIKNITSGIVRFTISIKDIKKIKQVVKKSKCSLKVIKKKGMYFKAFRYRKRKLLIPLIIIIIIGINIFNKMIWNIKISGNEEISSEHILEKAIISGLNKGKFKSSMDTNYLIKCMKNELPELAWIGIEYRGTTAYIRVVEKTKIPDEIIYNKSEFGDIIANKSGVITKIVAENGTAVHSAGSYIESGMTLIKGIMKSEILGDYQVRASGIVLMDVEYVFEREYSYENIIKNSLDKHKYTIGFSFNDNEICLNYLNKNKKYDTLKSSKAFNLFGNRISFDFYNFNEYTESLKVYSYNELLEMAWNQKEDYKNSLLNENSVFSGEEEEIENLENGIKYRCTIIMNEKVGIFKGE